VFYNSRFLIFFLGTLSCIITLGYAVAAACQVADNTEVPTQIGLAFVGSLIFFLYLRVRAR
jgi:hypothetical protein